MKEKFPFIIYFRDYHDINIIGDILREIFGKKIQCCELDKEKFEIDCDYYYYGLFWLRGEKPKPKEILSLPFFSCSF